MHWKVVLVETFRNKNTAIFPNNEQIRKWNWIEGSMLGYWPFHCELKRYAAVNDYIWIYI